MVIWASQSVQSHVTQTCHKAKTGVGGIHYTVDQISCDLNFSQGQNDNLGFTVGTITCDLNLSQS